MPPFWTWLAVWCLWSFACFAWAAYAYITVKKLHFDRLQSEKQKNRFKVFQRLDQDNLKYWQIAFGSVFFMPIRFLLFTLMTMSVLFVYACLTLFIPTEGTVSSNLFTRILSRIILEANFKIGFLVAGLVIREHDRGTTPPRTLKRSFPWTVPRLSDTTSTLTIVSNHVSMIDILYFMWSIRPAFLAKASVGKVPLLSATARSLGCIFVERNSEEERKRVIDDLRKRQSLGSNTNATPLVIFAEGTTSNGVNLLPFKRGAFVSLEPVIPVVLVYRCPMFNYAYDSIPAACWIPLAFSNPCISILDVYWLPVVTPKYCSRTSSVTTTDDDAAVVNDDTSDMVSRYTEEVREIMSDFLLKEHHVKWKEPVVYPADWSGSLPEKLECMHTLLGSDVTSKPHKE